MRGKNLTNVTELRRITTFEEKKVQKT